MLWVLIRSAPEALLMSTHMSPWRNKNKSNTFQLKNALSGVMLISRYFRKISSAFPVSILRKSISGRHRPVRVADGPMTARCRFT